jgi:hypothetical protein
MPESRRKFDQDFKEVTVRPVSRTGRTAPFGRRLGGQMQTHASLDRSPAEPVKTGGEFRLTPPDACG